MSTPPEKSGSCCASPTPFVPAPGGYSKSWNARYVTVIAVLAALWWLIYSNLVPAVHWLTFSALGFEEGARFGSSLEFFIYDTMKILMLLAALIYAIAWVRASMKVEKVRDFLAGKRRALGYFLGAAFGAVTPFCSCSSIPLFLGFTGAGIPIGISMSFLITSPLINELAVVLLWGLLGWKFTVAYVVVGMAAGMIGGLVMDSLRAGRWLQPFIIEMVDSAPANQIVSDSGEIQKLTVKQRHNFAYDETVTVYKRVWKWVIIGVGIGAALHGFVPANWFAENFGANEWWTVPAAVLVSVPLYSNVTGIIPIMESLLLKGLPLGTTMAFCMGAVVASIPEVMMLRQIMTWKLQVSFIAYLWIMLNIVGWLFNALVSLDATPGPSIL